MEKEGKEKGEREKEERMALVEDVWLVIGQMLDIPSLGRWARSSQAFLRLARKVPRYQQLRETKTIEQAARRGYFEVVQWLHRKQEKEKEIDWDSLDAVYAAGINGHFHIADWIYQQNPNQCWSSFFSLISREGEHVLPLLKWIHRTVAWINARYVDRAFDVACSDGYLVIAQWINSVQPRRNYGSAFEGSCQAGQLKIAKWIWSLNPYLDLHQFEDALFTRTCIQGHLEVAQWLREIAPRINLQATGDKAFLYACLEGHSEVARWLGSLTTYSSTSLLQAYSISVDRGDLEMLQWITLRCSADSLPQKESFRVACSLGHTQIVEWLLQQNPLLAEDVICFILAHRKEHTLIVSLLLRAWPEHALFLT